MTPNPHTFPLVATTSLAPELDIRSGMGGCEPYALDAPTDRLLPFVLARRISPRNAYWLSCAWLAHADTGEKLVVLVPTGAQPDPASVPQLGLVVQKLTDALTLTEYFTYGADLIPGLVEVIPCGVPLRLVVDNAYQSPRFYAIGLAADLSQTHLPLEWYHDGPLQGVPYGRGFRQQLYIDNGSLQHLDERVEQETTKDPNGGPDRLDSLQVYAQQQFTVSPAPRYLSEAVGSARAVRTFLADGQPWRLLSVKSTLSGEGGRWSLSGTVEDENPILSRGVKNVPLPLQAYDPTFMPRGWRCGDTSDVASDFTPTGAYSCETSSTGQNSGYVLEEYADLNPYSPTHNQTEQRRSTNQDLVRCPLQVRYTSDAVSAFATRNDCAAGYTGSREEFQVAAGAYMSDVSKADATAQAQAYANSQAQAYANTNGTCTLTGNYRPVFDDNGCFTCQMVNVNDPTDVRGATQQEADTYYVASIPDPNGSNIPIFYCPACVI